MNLRKIAGNPCIACTAQFNADCGPKAGQGISARRFEDATPIIYGENIYLRALSDGAAERDNYS